ncbi:hypothetical protein BH10PLA2_BH10PLA2_36030 [soil metagenome]
MIRYYFTGVLIWLSLAALATAQDKPEKSAVIDRDLLAGVEDKTPVQSANENYAEARAYDYLMVHAHGVSPAELKRQARTDLTFVHLFEEPAKYRGQLITLKGRLLRLRRFDPTPLGAKEGLKDLFEGWLLADGTVTNPFGIVASEIGAGLKPGEKIDREVTFTGYFFKRYRYQAGDGWRDAPLLIGRSIEPIGSTAAAPPALLGTVYMPLIFGILGTTLVLALGLAWYLRQGDRQVRARLAELRSQQAEKARGNGEGNPFPE